MSKKQETKDLGPIFWTGIIIIIGLCFYIVHADANCEIYSYPDKVGDINITMYYDEDFTEKLELEDEKEHEEESKEWNKDDDDDDDL